MTIRCAICQADWTEDTGVVVGHPTEVHICDVCFDADIAPHLRAHGAPVARPTEAPCLAHWHMGSVRVGVTIPGKSGLE